MDNLNDWARRDTQAHTPHHEERHEHPEHGHGNHEGVHHQHHPHHDADHLYYPQINGMPGLPEPPVYPPHHGHAHKPHLPGPRPPQGNGQIPVPCHLYGVMNPNASITRNGATFTVRWGDNAMDGDKGAGSTSTAERTVTLVYYRPQIIYNISNVAYVEGDVAPQDAQPLRHHIQAIADEGNLDRINSLIDLAFAACVELLYPYTKQEIGEFAEYEDIDNRPDHVGILEVTLTLPSTFSATTLNLLAKLIDEYILCTVLAEWLNILDADASARWFLKAEAATERIKKALQQRIKRVRRRPSPFQ